MKQQAGLVLVVAAALTAGACRTRLPVDPPATEAAPPTAEAPALDSSRGVASRWVQRTDPRPEGISQRHVEISNDRLRGLVRHRDQGGRENFLGVFTVHVDHCIPGSHR